MNDGAAASLSGSPAVHLQRHAACPHLQVVTNLSLHTRKELGDIADGMKHSPCIARRWLIPVGVRPDAGLVWPTLAVNSIWVQQSGRRTSLPEPPRGGIRVPPARRTRQRADVRDSACMQPFCECEQRHILAAVCHPGDAPRRGRRHCVGITHTGGVATAARLKRFTKLVW